jgi:hypothetical protein
MRAFCPSQTIHGPDRRQSRKEEYDPDISQAEGLQECRYEKVVNEGPLSYCLREFCHLALKFASRFAPL